MFWTAAAAAVFFLFSPAASLVFDCAEIAEACICYKEQGGTEIQCPNKPLASFPISFKIVPLSDGAGKLTINCDPENEHFNSSLAKGLKFNQTLQDFTLSRIEVNFCPSIDNALEDFFDEVEIDGRGIRGFAFVTYSRRNISALPTNFLSSMPNLEDLSLKSNKLSTFPHIPALTQLKSLNLYDNLLDFIPDDALSSNVQLSSLQLNKNKLTHLPPTALPVSLTYLNLANNRISVLTRETLSRLKLLRVLDLRWNPLSDMEQDVFTDMDELRILNIDSSQFKNFPSLVNLTKLTNVSISHAEGANVLSGDERGKMEELPGLISNLPSLTGLVLANDSLPSLPLLENLPNLTYINLSRNRIVKIPKGAFGNLPALTTIDLTRNLISEVEEIRATFLTSLDLSGNLIESLSNGAFKYLAKLKKLNLAYNKISIVSPRAFESQTELEWLDMSQNLIEFRESEEERRSFPSNAPLFADSEIPQSPLRFCPKLKTVLLRNNSIRHLDSELSYNLLHLSTLDLSHNKFKTLNALDLNFISLDLRLDLSNNELRVIDMKDANIYLDSEVSDKKRMVVKLDGNPLNCDCRLLPFKNFSVKWISFSYENLNCASAVLPNIRNKSFKDVGALDLVCPLEGQQGCPSTCSCLIRPADEKVILNCTPTTSVFPPLAALEKNYNKFDFHLNLANKGISHIETNDTKGLSPHVVFVDLSGNELKSLGFLSGLGDQNQTSFSLGFNRFGCKDCEFHGNLRGRFRQIADFSNLTCVLDEGEVVKVSTLRGFDSLCNDLMSAQVKIILIFFIIFTFSLVLAAVLYVRHGWALRAYLYSKGYSCFCLNDDYEGDEEKIYDAFVSYSHHDEEWVLEKLVNRLEEEEGFKLCLHFRDWTPGDWIPDQIVRSVDTSRRTVVVLSKHFVDSVWSKLEFKAAHSQALKERSNKVILILMDDELKESECGDEDLRIYMKMNTYLKWGDPWFWHKLKYALPHRTRPNLVQVHEQRQRAIMLDKLREKMEPI